MKSTLPKLPIVLIAILLAGVAAFGTGCQKKEQAKIGFLIHDLVSERWNHDIAFFTEEVQQLGGSVTLKNAFGDAQAQIEQGKALIDEGIKVLVVVAHDGNKLAELVDYANQKGAKIIAYDRMIKNSDLHYYISYNSIKVGELMAEYALQSHPKGNYVLLYGPSEDHNALLIKQGILNKLKQSIEGGSLHVIDEKEMESWYALTAYMHMEEFLATNTQPVDVVIASGDNMAAGAIDALKGMNKTVLVTGQDASIEACKNIVTGHQAMSVFKSIKKLSTEAARLAMDVASGKRINYPTTVHNGKYDVPSILFGPVTVDKSNLRSLVTEGHMNEAEFATL